MSVASQPVPAPAPSAKEAGADERTGGVRLIVRLLQRPELGALLGAMAVYALFATVDATPGHRFSSIAGMQNWTDVASSYAIMAVPVPVLMIRRARAPSPPGLTARRRPILPCISPSPPPTHMPC